MSPGVLLLAFLGGVVPTFIWLFFWLLEDRCQPEPKRFIFYTFLCGMIAVLIALPLERSVAPFLPTSFMLFFVWAIIEECLKYGAAYFAALRFSVFDEPLDAVVYMVTAALGFSALENAMFLWSPLSQNEILHALLTENLRFMGATLLHVLASATIGLALALAFTKPAGVRKMAAWIGVILAIFLHTMFNFLILQGGQNPTTFWIFMCVWFGIIVTLLFTEHIKQPAKDYC